LELNESDFSLFHASWSSGIFNDTLVQNESFYKFCVIDRSSNFLYDTDIIEIDVLGCGRDDHSHDCIDSNRREKSTVLGYDFGVEGGRCGTKERCTVCEGDFGSYFSEMVDTFCCC